MCYFFCVQPNLISFGDSQALHNAWSPIIAALFAGNSIVLKCSENVVWSTTWFVQAIKECLRACGHDEELVQVRTLTSVSRYKSRLIQNIARLLLPRRGFSTHKVTLHPPHHLHRLRARRADRRPGCYRVSYPRDSRTRWKRSCYHPSFH